MSSKPDASEEELWSEIKSVDLRITLPLTTEGTTRYLKSDWIIRVAALDPMPSKRGAKPRPADVPAVPSFQVQIDYTFPLKVEEVIVTGKAKVRIVEGPGLRHPVFVWTGPEQVKSTGFTFSTAKQTTDPVIAAISVVVKYRSKANLDREALIASKSKSPCMDSLSSHFKDLFLSSDGSDVVFEIESEEIFAHTIILSARVPYFKSLFASGMQESVTKRIRVEEFSAKAFKQFLKLIYSGELPDDMEEGPGVYLPLAEKYGMEDFKMACVKSMSVSLTSENVVSTFIAADLFHCPMLKAECLSFFEGGDVPKPSLGPLKEYPSLMFELIERLT